MTEAENARKLQEVWNLEGQISFDGFGIRTFSYFLSLIILIDFVYL